ncbi:MAG: hypothetical protein JWM56_425 [Candidatus Peribacteria bacterium]|nr:hypothetical protein [Candidatus Peribacteria bacterium]
MITFSSLTSGIKVTGPDKTFIVYPKSSEGASQSTQVLLSVPEEEPTANTISWPGEYNIGSVSLKGIAHRDGQQVSFVAIMDDVRLCFISSPLQQWSDAQMETAGNIDVLVMPTGDIKLIQKLVDEFDPRILVLVPGEEGDPEDPMFKALGANDASMMKEFKLKGGLPQEGRQVVVLA